MDALDALTGLVRSETVAYQIGEDLGRIHDPTAIAVARVVRETHRRERKDGPGVEDYTVYVFEVPFLQRLPLDQNYRAIGRRSAEIVSGVIDKADAEYRVLAQGFNPPPRPAPVHLIADATGVGQAVCDIIAAELPTRCRVTYATLTAGRDITGSLGDAMSVGKHALVSGLSAKLETDRIRIAKGAIDAEALQAELRDFEMGMTTHGNVTTGAKAGAHDDLVIAVGLATCIDGSLGGAVGSVEMPWE